jgi:uncharacterized membrane protein
VLANYELRAMAREQLKGNWGNPVIVTLIYMVIIILVSVVPYVGGIISFILSGPFILGLVTYFINLKRGNNSKIENIFSGFSNFGSALVLNLLMCIFIFLWTLLLIVPGIIASLRYSMAYYILSDNPDIGAMNALNKSKELMQHNKKKLFSLWISFIGWGLCCILTLGIGFLWLIPYMSLSMVNFYEDIIKIPQIDNPVVEVS